MVEVVVLRVDERVAFLEGRVTEFSQVLQTVQQGIATLNERFTGVEQRITGLEQRMDHRFAAVDVRFTTLEDKLSRQFYWVVGMQLTTVVAIIGALMTALLAR